ncbi:MAG: (2Fe-2S)-binding protein [Gammaproteobacteria bacterium]|nr:MAG: (2Fe-2S)-binding protein [Gammaproteobacteria bacterium]
MVKFRLNGQDVSVEVPDEMPLLWVLRDTLGYTGTKYGCGMALCGACTVHLDGQSIRSCVVPVSAVAGRSITSIEGIGKSEQLHPVQQAWIDEQVPQCGYCQPGMIMAVAAFLEQNPQPDDEAINRSITNICRCGTYPRIRRAIHRAAELRRQST